MLLLKKIQYLSLMSVRKIEAFKVSLLTLCVYKIFCHLMNMDCTLILPIDKKSTYFNFTKLNSFLCR